MKHFFTFLLSIVLGVAFGREISAHQNVDAKDHLLTVNKQWVYFEDAIPDEKQSFSNDTERIAYHLRTVVELLSAQTTTHLNSDQLEKRKQTIQILEGYADRKVFPTNHYHAVRQPYFIDNYDVHCAVGYLVKETGYPEISKEIASTQNYAYVKEIKSEALLQWAKEYGFSVQELALIQPTYPSENYSGRLGNAPNGEVKDLKTSNNKMAVVGTFTEVENGACVNIAYYENGVYTCFGNGIEGDAKGIIHYDRNSDLLIVYGEFISNGITYPVAKFENDMWSFLAIPNHTNAIAMAGSKTDGADGFKVSIEVIGQPHKQEVFSYTLANGWELEANVYGEINTLDYGAYGGDYDTIYIYNNQQEYYSAGLILSDLNNGFVTFDDGLPVSIYTLEMVNQELFIGGMHYRDSSFNNPILCKYVNDTLSTLVHLSHLADNSPWPHGYIEDMHYHDGRLYFGGFIYPPIISWTYYRHFFYIYPDSGYGTGAQTFNGSVKALEVYDDGIVVGGKVSGYLVSWNESSAGVENEENIALKVYPNPASSMGILTLEIPSQESIETISILDMKGSRTSLHTTFEITLPDISEGTYMLEVKMNSGKILREKLIIQ